MIRELIHDFDNILGSMPKNQKSLNRLKVIRGALVRNAHFIERHRADYPQAFFQTMWNQCWWYDSPETNFHIENPQARSTEHQMEAVFGILEEWRAEKQILSISRPWMRALRPPASLISSNNSVRISGFEVKVSSMATSPTAPLLATGHSDGGICIWEIPSGIAVHQFASGLTNVAGIAYSATGKYLAAFCKNEVRIMDHDTGDLLNSWTFQNETVVHIASVIDRSEFVLGTKSGLVFRIDVARSDFVQLYSGAAAPIVAVSCDRAGTRIAVVTVDGTVMIWDLFSGSQISLVKLGLVESSPEMALQSGDSSPQALFAKNIRFHVTRSRRESGYQQIVDLAVFSSDL